MANNMASLRSLCQTSLLLSLFCSPIAPTWGLEFPSYQATPSSNTEYNNSSSLLRVATASSGQQGYTCGPGNPCTNGACCGESGWCGYGTKYCGSGCQSNCDAKAECGENAATPGQTCPLNVCCSQYGFCGTTSEFCGDGCQSNCPQPKPSVGPSNTQKRIIGYWESWNSQHACGTMSPGEIPVTLLTHLNVAFGYINSAFQVTNMDGVAPELYKSIGDVKSRNPSIKLIIALGGWTFSDPGPWQDIFPTMVSTEANRATFIRNLLGFLSEYGYDGVDFDWEYPGAGDRGGSKQDGVNYTAMLKELRAAIDASGKGYIVTFTAPTSYWYLQNFDIENMVRYVDWVNLMSYDLHGVWDSDNPIGSQVLAHTNLTEIDLALDLFWRAGVDPADLVLGLGLYGRSFQLTDSSCWKPGCKFSGPGEAGPCTATPGILSFREIKQIIQSTGASSYLDTEAAVRYLVYGNNSWISFDDEATFRAKINHANKNGLGGLMVWAVDLDDNGLNALNAISDAGHIGAIDNPFALVDLEHLFPKEVLPSKGSKPSYGLINFGSLAAQGSMNPSKTAFGFLLVAGDSFAVTQLRKREGLPDPFVFLDCPADVAEQSKDMIQKARVVCMTDSMEGCFRVMERGVEGTIVEMPDNCAPNTLARAVSLELAQDQSVPVAHGGSGRSRPTSQVYEFSFDFNMKRVRRDSKNTSLRLDYSNIQGYWDSIVDSPGIQSRDLGSTLASRFFAPTKQDWEKAYSDSDPNGVGLHYKSSDAISVKEDMSAPLFWQTTGDQCVVEGGDYQEGFGAYVTGNLDASYYYGFSMVATLDGIGSMDVKQANGLLKITGQTDLTYTIGGIGSIDISRAGKGNPAFHEMKEVSLPGHTVNTGNHGSVIFEPYYQITYQMATLNGSDEDTSFSSAAFNGLMSTRTISDLGDFEVFYPPLDPKAEYEQDKHRKQNKISVSSENVLYNSRGKGGEIAIGTYVKFGLKVNFFFFADLFKWSIGLPDQGPADADLCYPNAKGLTNDKRSLAPEQLLRVRPAFEVADINTTTPGGPSLAEREAEYDDAEASAAVARRQSGGGGGLMPGWGYGDSAGIDPLTYLGTSGKNAFSSKEPKFKCRNCVNCEEDDEEGEKCCGCTCMQCAFGFRDIPYCAECDEINPTGETPWPGPSYSLSARPGEGIVSREKHGIEERDKDPTKIVPSKKNVKFCRQTFGGEDDYRYPPFPQDPNKDWYNMDNGKWRPISA
ncbi:hypothetical protein PG984_015111 [Apiospora sp. TS-2023a]